LRLDQQAGKGADVGPAVTSDLGCVGDAAEGDALELAAESGGDGAAEARLADSGGAEQAEQRAAHLAAQRRDG